MKPKVSRYPYKHEKKNIQVEHTPLTKVLDRPQHVALISGLEATKVIQKQLQEK